MLSAPALIVCSLRWAKDEHREQRGMTVRYVLASTDECNSHCSRRYVPNLSNRRY